jgi:hypothetical protein
VPSSKAVQSNYETKLSNLAKLTSKTKKTPRKTVQFAGNTDFGSKSKVTRQKKDPTMTMKGNKKKRFQKKQPRKTATKTVEMKKTGTNTMAKRISGLFQRMTGGPKQEPKNPSTARTTKKSNNKATPKGNTTTTTKKASKKKASKKSTGATKKRYWDKLQFDLHQPSNVHSFRPEIFWG